MIYARFKSNISAMPEGSRENLHLAMQEIALSSKAVSTEFFLKKLPTSKINFNGEVAMIGNPAPLKSIRLEKNPKIERKADSIWPRIRM